MDTKDIFSLGLSGMAFVLSLVATFLTLRQKKFETERTLRHQLTDAIGKLNSAFEESAKLRQEKAESLNEPAVVSLFSFYNGQKVFYARQAVYVAEQIPHLVSDAEYNSLARAFVDVDDDQHALLYYEKAIAAANGPLYKATNLRGYGRILIRMGKLNEGRAAFKESLSLVSGSSDSSRWFQAETLQRWAQIEAGAGERTNAEDLLSDAEALYTAIQFPPRRNTGLRNLAAVRKTLLSPPTPKPSDGAELGSNNGLQADALQAARA